MNKKVVLLPLFALLLAGCGKTPTSSSVTSSNGGGISIPSEDSSIEVSSEPTSEVVIPELVAIKDVGNYASGTPLTVGGKVTRIYQDSDTTNTKSVAIQDGADAMLLYGVTADVLGSIKVGDVVRAKGTNAPYFDLQELNPVTEITVATDLTFTAEAEEITVWDNAAYVAKDSNFVHVTDVHPFEDNQVVAVDNHSDFYVKIGAEKVDLRINRNLGTDVLTAIAAKLNGLNAAVDTVSAYGILGSYKGTAQITIVDAADVTVTKGVAAGAVTGVRFVDTDGTTDLETTTVNQYANYTLGVEVAPADAADKTVSFVSDNEAVATVDAAGVVKGISAGTATITVTTTEGSFTDTIAVTVAAVTPLTVEGARAAANNEVVTVKGVVTSNPGNNDYTIQSGDYAINVYNSSAIKEQMVVGHEVVLVGTKAVYNGLHQLAKGVTAVTDLGVAATPIVVKDLGETWDVAALANHDNRLVSVTGTYVSGSVTVGSATTIKLSVGGTNVDLRTNKYLPTAAMDAMKAEADLWTANVTKVKFTGVIGWFNAPQLSFLSADWVEDVTPAFDPATSVNVTSAGGAVSLVAYQTLQLSAEVLPATASQAVTWSSSAETVATVDSAGLVTGVAAGSVTITATSQTVGILGTIDLTVTAAAATLFYQTGFEAPDFATTTIYNEMGIIQGTAPYQFTVDMGTVTTTGASAFTGGEAQVFQFRTYTNKPGQAGALTPNFNIPNLTYITFDAQLPSSAGTPVLAAQYSIDGGTTWLDMTIEGTVATEVSNIKASIPSIHDGNQATIKFRIMNNTHTVASRLSIDNLKVFTK